MRNEQIQTELNWTALGGKILDGGYELEELLEASDAGANFKVRVLGDRTLESFATFRRMSRAAATEQVEFWQALKRSPHPNLDRPLAAGETELDGTGLVYVILRKADETLSGALIERVLTAAETTEVLRNVAAALEYLNDSALVHGSVSPCQILSVGEAIQLSVDPIGSISNEPRTEKMPKYLAPESISANGTPESDVWCLGATLVEALTQKDCRERCLQMARELPVPFAWVAERCLEEDPKKRAKAADIPKLLAEGERPAARAATVGTVMAAEITRAAIPIVEEPVAKEPWSKSPALQEPVLIKSVEARAAAMRASVGTPTSSARPVASRAFPPATTEPSKNTSSRIEQRRTLVQDPSSRLWLYAITGVVVLLFVIWWAWPRQAKVPASTAAAASIAAAQTQTITPEGTASNNGVPQTVAPLAVGTPTSPRIKRSVPAAKTQAEAPTVNGSTWRVVAFTYNRSEDAQKKAKTINGRHPQLAATVFTPSGNSGPYLVTLGGTMGREAAVRLRQKALSQGLPRDSYIQNYRK